jgi:hypothetical protein
MRPLCGLLDRLQSVPTARKAFQTGSHFMLIVRSRQSLTATVFAATLLTGLARVAEAQTPSATARGASRAELEAKARTADSLGRKQEAFALQARLRDGDFDIGDRVLVLYEGLGLTKRDTLVVQAGRTLRLGDPMGDLNLLGVLRSELSDSVTKRVARYYRNEVVHVTPLLRVSVEGPLLTPGFYYLPNDAPLSDLLVRGGQRSAGADPENIVIRRGEVVLWAKDDVQSALADGLTLQQLNLEPGDELVVGTRPTNWVMPALQIGLSLVAVAITFLVRRH